MVNFLKFLFSRHFWGSIITMILLSIFLIWLAFNSLNWYTHHGESITVPDLKSFTLDKADKLLQSKDLRYAILDSTFVKELKPGTVVDQSPLPGEKVKEKRRIYLTIASRTPPPVAVPNIIYASARNAEEQLSSIGLLLGRPERVPDPAKNVVLDIKYKGKSIRPGTEIPKGDSINLVLGNGVGDTRVQVPELIGLTFHEARLALRAWSLNVGAVVKSSGVNNLDDAVIYKQSPSPEDNREITVGEPVDLWLQNPQIEDDFYEEEEEETATENNYTPPPAPRPEPRVERPKPIPPRPERRPAAPPKPKPQPKPETPERVQIESAPTRPKVKLTDVEELKPTAPPKAEEPKPTPPPPAPKPQPKVEEPVKVVTIPKEEAPKPTPPPSSPPPAPQPKPQPPQNTAPSNDQPVKFIVPGPKKETTPPPPSEPKPKVNILDGDGEE